MWFLDIEIKKAFTRVLCLHVATSIWGENKGFLGKNCVRLVKLNYYLFKIYGSKTFQIRHE